MSAGGPLPEVPPQQATALYCLVKLNGRRTELDEAYRRAYEQVRGLIVKVT